MVECSAGEVQKVGEEGVEVLPALGHAAAAVGVICPRHKWEFFHIFS